MRFIQHFTYYLNIKYKRCIVSFINSSITNLSYYTLNTSIVSFVNSSIISQNNLYNISLVSFINTSIVNSQTNLTSITNLSSLNCSFTFVNISTLTTKNGNIINISSTNSSFQNISVSYLILYNSTVNSGLICQSKTSTNMLRVIPYNGGTGNYNPAVQTGDFLFVIGNVSGTIDSHSRTLSGLRIDGVNNTFSGSLTVTSNLSTANIQQQT